jgi:teichuronic acid biosynthesis glycosyltransferase TuaC
MHVLLLPSWYGTADVPWNGTFFENQAVALGRAGVQVGVAFVEPRSLRALSARALRASHFQVETARARNVTTIRMKGWNTFGQSVSGARIWSLLTERLVRVYVRRHGVPDVVHAHAALWAGHAAVRAGLALQRPVVITEHSSLVMTGALGAAERREAANAYRRARAVFAVSRPLADAVDSLAGRETTRVMPNAVDLDFFTPPQAPRIRDPFTFLSVCSLVPGKRVDLLIRAFGRLASTHPGVRLVIVGSGVEGPRLRQFVQTAGLAACVEFAGGLERDGVREWMWRANALVVSSVSETFGVVLVEALGTGLPVIATRSGGPEEIVEPGLGLLVARDDEHELANALQSIIARSYEPRALRERVIARYSFQRIAEQLVGAYAALRA